MLRVAVALLLTLVASFSAGAAGHDVSAVRYALIANSAGDTAIVTSEFDNVWLIDRAKFYFASELPVQRRRAAF